MRGWIAATGCMLLLAGCGPTAQMATAPGSPLPGGFAVCAEHYSGGRCADWRSATDTCVHWNGIDARGPDGAATPFVPCDTVPRRMRAVGIRGGTSPLFSRIDAERAAAGLPAIE